MQNYRPKCPMTTKTRHSRGGVPFFRGLGLKLKGYWRQGCQAGIWTPDGSHERGLPGNERNETVRDEELAGC